MRVRAIRCFTDKTMNEKKGGVRWKGDEFDVTSARAKELMKHNAVEAVEDEPDPNPDDGGESDE